MNICEAVLAVGAENPFIARQCWLQEIGRHSGPSAYLQPTDSVGCVMHSQLLNTGKIWTPTLQDLLADDWTTTQGF